MNIQSKGLLVEPHYLLPISCFQYAYHACTIYLEAHGRYAMQSYQNRCYILTAQGIHKLIVPIEKRRGERLYKEVKIAYALPWITQHLRTLATAYGQSPYYEALSDLLLPVFMKRPQFLIDLNIALTEVFFQFLQMDKPILTTQSYREQPVEGLLDLRGVFHPKKERQHAEIKFPVYPQRFQPCVSHHLSSIDLFCSQGPYIHQLLHEK